MAVTHKIVLTQPNSTQLSKKSREALASLRLEGIEPSQALLDDIHAYEAGKLTQKQLMKRGIKRATQ